MQKIIGYHGTKNDLQNLLYKKVLKLHPQKKMIIIG